MQIMFFIALLVAFIAVVFALQNTMSVTVIFLWWHFDTSLALALLIALIMGALVIALISISTTFRNRWLIKRQQRRIEELEKRGEAATLLSPESNLPISPK